MFCIIELIIITRTAISLTKNYILNQTTCMSSSYYKSSTVDNIKKAMQTERQAEMQRKGRKKGKRCSQKERQTERQNGRQTERQAEIRDRQRGRHAERQKGM